MLQSVIGDVDVAQSVLSPLKDGETVASPGMKYKHYAPEADVIVACGTLMEMAGIIKREYDKAEAKGKKCVILASKETQSFYRGKKYDIIGSATEKKDMCANLFSKLRQYSDAVDVIFAESVSTDDMGLAYMNRLLRASGFTVLTE